MAQRPDLSHLRPMLAVSGRPAAVTRGHAFEFKWDGVRALVHTDGRQVAVRGRNGVDATARYPELARLGQAVGRAAVLDGEVVALDPVGRPDFGRLQERMHLSNPARVAAVARRVPVVYLAFDLLALDGTLLLDEPYEARREALLGLDLGGPAWQVPPAGDDLAAFLEVAGQRGLEGVVAKRRGSLYRPGARSPDWVKLKLRARQEVVVGGWRPERGQRGGRIGALLVGVYDDAGRLRYAGAVGSGLRGREVAELAAVLRPAPASPFLDPVPQADASFVHPDVVVEVRFSEWTGDGRLRHPVYLGRRDDRRPTDVRREPRVP